MHTAILFGTTGRILRQLRHDHRTVALLVVVPAVLLTLLYYMYENVPGQFDAIALIMLGIFPFIIMFLVTSIAMLRERTSGTLERLLTSPMGKLDLLFGYGFAFGIAAAVQASCRVRRRLLGLRDGDCRRSRARRADRGTDRPARRRARPALLRVRPHRVPGRAVPARGGDPTDPAVRAVRPARRDGGLAAVAEQRDAADLRGEGPAGGRHVRRTPRPSSSRTSRWWPAVWSWPWRSPRPRCGGGRPELPRPRSGRRRGNPNTRDEILQAARTLFSTQGYRATSIRQIAAAAHVDPALVHHYFTSKEQLFVATVNVQLDVTTVLGSVLASDPDEFGRNLIRAIITVWDSDAGPGLIAAIRTALGDPTVGEAIREFVASAILSTVAVSLRLTPDEGPRRTGLVASQIVGVVVARYLLRFEPMASMSADELADAVGPTVQRYLTGPMSAPDGTLETQG